MDLTSLEFQGNPGTLMSQLMEEYISSVCEVFRLVAVDKRHVNDSRLVTCLWIEDFSRSH